MTELDRNKIVAALARKHLGIQTLETRKRDALDFHDVAVWSVADALAEAFEAGRREVVLTKLRAEAERLGSKPIYRDNDRKQAATIRKLYKVRKQIEALENGEPVEAVL